MGITLVLGLGESGYWASRLVLEVLGQGLMVMDESFGVQDRALDLAERARGLGLSFEARLGARFPLPPEVSRVVVSPGVPASHPLLIQARDKGVEVVGELELAFGHLETPVMAITGTNGKTTVTSLVGHLLERLGYRVWVGGNIGTPLSRLVLEETSVQWVILEVSSFQLEWVKEFRPSIGALLNLGEDHLDRHGSLEEYLSLKLRLAARQGPDDALVVSADDPFLQGSLSSMEGRIYGFSRLGSVERGLGVAGGSLLWRDEKGEESLSLDSLPAWARLQLDNVLAALALGRLVGPSLEEMVPALEGYRLPPHRLELVDVRGGIRFYDDSKATNPPAVARALSMIEGPVVLLMGGRNKGFSFRSLRRAVMDRVKALVVFGEAAGEIARDLGDTGVPLFLAQGLEGALSLALDVARERDAVLLSPGCASFDEFSSYKERGEFFRKLVASALDL